MQRRLVALDSRLRGNERISWCVSPPSPQTLLVLVAVFLAEAIDGNHALVLGVLSTITRRSLPRNLLALVAVFLAQALDGNHALVLGGVEHDHPLRGAPGDTDAGHRRADELAGVGDEHHLIALLHRE